jgi:formate/nitrite transporter FocA (FNT family)
MAEGNKSKQTRREKREIREHLRLKAPMIYQVVREEGEEELARPLTSLWWSGVAAGFAISMSIVSEAALRRSLPETPWASLIAHFGYCVGFIIVVLGRLQLFTENTVTAVLPVMAEQTAQSVLKMLRLWIIVFAANFVGTAIFALATTYIGFFPDAQLQEMLSISHHLAAKPPLDMMLSGVAAGFLIAAMVWMLPSAQSAAFWVVTLMTYIIAISDLAHVVAGSAEIGLLVANGELGVLQAAGGFLLPAFVGNVIGGTALFALLAYGQVMEEL